MSFAMSSFTENESLGLLHRCPIENGCEYIKITMSTYFFAMSFFRENGSLGLLHRCPIENRCKYIKISFWVLNNLKNIFQSFIYYCQLSWNTNIVPHLLSIIFLYNNICIFNPLSVWQYMFPISFLYCIHIKRSACLWIYQLRLSLVSLDSNKKINVAYLEEVITFHYKLRIYIAYHQ